ncbi:MAG TPA: 5'-nucleotidase C-terminal domain-containing protein, partial [Dongiaceae bacterium]|nr:5'-nucleotidase C-terminal domain-containing protein [Dongiaceae bacterium]
GVRIGVLGLCYRHTPTVTLAKYVAHLTFEDDSATAVRLVPALAKRSDIVIGVGHIPAETDSTRAARGGDLPRLARGVPGVAAWFGGHSHNLVCDRVAGVPVMIAGAHGEVVGVCDLVVDPIANRVIDSRFDLVRTWADEVTPDSAMAARVERWNAAVAPLAAKRLGANRHALRRNRGGEGTVGDVVADAMRAASGVDIALQNSGGLRADLEEGDITRGAVYEVMPFDNLVFTLGLTGAEVRVALEQALKYNRVTQVSGIRYTFDSSRPAMDRVLTLTDTRGAPLDSAKVYRVAVNDFMATGGDNYDVLSGGRNRENSSVLVRDALEQFIAERCAKGPLDVSPDGRIQRVGGRGDGAGD